MIACSGTSSKKLITGPRLLQKHALDLPKTHLFEGASSKHCTLTPLDGRKNLDISGADSSSGHELIGPRAIPTDELHTTPASGTDGLAW